MITAAAVVPDAIEVTFQAARAKRIEALTPGMLAALTARITAGEPIGELEVTAALEAVGRQASREAFEVLKAEDARGAFGPTLDPEPEPLNVFDLWQLEGGAL